MFVKRTNASRAGAAGLIVLVTVLLLGTAAVAWGQETGGAVDVGRAQRISLNLQDVTLGNVLKVMTQKSGINFLIGADLVGKRINVYLEDVLVEDALAAIMRANGLWYTRQKGTNIYVIMDAPEGPPVTTVTEVVKTNFADANELAPTLEAVLTEVGSIVVDVRTNALVISDIPENITTLQALARDLDEPSGQILIEAKIVEVHENDGLQLGVEWDYVDFSAGSTDASYGSSFDTAEENVFDLTLGMFDSFQEVQDFTARLSAMVHEGVAEILATPSVLTLDNKEAYIGITEHIALARKTTFRESGASSQVEPIYGDIGVTLKVLPHLNNDQFVTMTIEPLVSGAEPSQYFPDDAVDTKTRTATTTVMVKDGQTVVIGGLLRTDVVENYFKVPLLGDIPLLGYLFKKTETVEKKTEIMLFLTPRIMGPEALKRYSERVETHMDERLEEQ
jgi:type IV pilus assembly protein PilQ